MTQVQLGQRVYGVSKSGEIIPTLINDLKLPVEYENKSKLAMVSARRFKGMPHPVSSLLQFYTINRSLNDTYLEFDQAYEAALTALDKLVSDDSISVRAMEKAKTKRLALLDDKEAERERVNGIEKFAVTHYSYGKKDPVCKQTDFPNDYHYPGESVLIADTTNWQLIIGFVTEVNCIPFRTAKLLYSCGSHTNITPDRVFTELTEALDYLAKVFEKTYPGTLDPQRVEIIQQISKSERFEQSVEKYARLAKRIKI